MSDDRVMPLSSNLTRARTTAIDAAAVAAIKNTADVKRMYKHLGHQDISRI